MTKLTWLFLVIGGAALAWMVRGIGPGHLETLIERIGWWFVALVALDLLQAAGSARALYLHLGDRPRKPSFASTLAASLAGQAINQLTPGGVLGEATKVTMLSRRGDRDAALSAVVAFNLTASLVAIVFLVVGALVALPFVPVEPGVVPIVVGASAALTVVAAALFWLGRSGPVAAGVAALARLRLVRGPRAAAWQAAARRVDETMHRLRTDAPAAMRAGVAWLVAARVCGMLATWLVLRLLHADVHPAFVLALVSLGTLLGWIADLVPFGVGAAEGGEYVLFRLLDQSGGTGVVVQLVGRVRKLVFVAIGLGVMLVAQLTSSNRQPVAR